MFNSIESTPSHPVTTRQPQHHSHRCPLFQVQRKHRLHQNPRRHPTPLNPKAPTSPTPTLAAVKPPRVELPPVTPSAKTQVQRITRLYPPSSKEETRLNLNYPTYPTPIHAPLCAHQIATIQHTLNLNCPQNSTHADPTRPHQNRQNLTKLNLTPPSKCVAVLSLAQDPISKPPTQPVPTFSRFPQVLEPGYPTKCVAVLSQPSEISDKPQTKSDPNQTCHNHR